MSTNYHPHINETINNLNDLGFSGDILAHMRIITNTHTHTSAALHNKNFHNKQPRLENKLSVSERINNIKNNTSLGVGSFSSHRGFFVSGCVGFGAKKTFSYQRTDRRGKKTFSMPANRSTGQKNFFSCQRTDRRDKKTFFVPANRSTGQKKLFSCQRTVRWSK